MYGNEGEKWVMTKKTIPDWSDDQCGRYRI